MFNKKEKKMKKYMLFMMLFLTAVNVSFCASSGDKGPKKRPASSSPSSENKGSKKRAASSSPFQNFFNMFSRRKVEKPVVERSASVPLPEEVIFADFTPEEVVGIPEASEAPEIPAIGEFVPIQESTSSSSVQSPDPTQESIASSSAQSPDQVVIRRRHRPLSVDPLAQKRDVTRSSSAPSQFLLDRPLTPASLRNPKGMARRPDIKWMNELEYAISDRNSRIAEQKELEQEQARRECLRQQEIERTYDNEMDPEHVYDNEMDEL
jgi:hypothetical protein